MAYAAAVSVVQILKQLLHTNPYPFQYPNPQQIQNLCDKVYFLQSFLKEVFPVPRQCREEVDNVENRIRDAIYRAQDTIEFFISRQIRSPEITADRRSTIPAFGIFSQTRSSKVIETPEDLREILKELDSITDAAKNIAGRVKRDRQGSHLSYPLPSGSTTKSDQIVGQEKDYSQKIRQRSELSKKIANLVKRNRLSKKIANLVKRNRQGTDLSFPLPSGSTTKSDQIVGQEKDFAQKIRQGSDLSFPLPSGSTTKSDQIVAQEKDFARKNRQGSDLSFPLPSGSTTKSDQIVGQEKDFARKNKEGSDLSFPLPSGSTTKSYQIVGQERDFATIKSKLLEGRSELQTIPISGMGGIGKTTLAKSIYDDPTIQTRFSTRAWVVVSQECHVGEILLKLLESMGIEGERAWNKGSVEQLSAHLHQALTSTRYLIVLDDMWDAEVWNKVRNSFPDTKRGSRIILTTRSSGFGSSHSMELMTLDKSWTLLSEKVFGPAGHCPIHLEDIGMNIADICRGLPLAISVVGGLLSKGRKDVEYWRIIEEDMQDAAWRGEDSHLGRLSEELTRDFEYQRDIVKDRARHYRDWRKENKGLDYDYPRYFERRYHSGYTRGDSRGVETYLPILSLSYKHLPAELQGCFMYMGAFPEDSEIPASKLIMLWIAEGFIVPPIPPQTLEQVAQQYLEELTDRNLILIHKKGSDGGIKTCGMHDVVRVLALEQCQRNNFFYSINRHELSEGTQSARRISVHRNTLMYMKDVYQRTQSNEVARTLVYAGQDYHYPLPFCLTFKLIRVLDALTVYFIEFPNVLVELIHLRYLGLTFNGRLPPSLSRLLNLQILIIHRHPNFIFIDTSILPVEVWSRMLQMRHLLIPDFDLPLPSDPHNSVILENLQSLSNVNAACCTKEILQNMPNLKKLGMWLESSSPVHLYLDQLQQLEALKFTVLKPVPGKMIDFQPKLAFPETLRKLSLSGCGIPWEDMTVIGELPHLQVLKLRNSAFQGEEWRPNAGQFLVLKFLLLEYLDLMSLRADRYHFPCLQRLIIRHCYELEKIERDIGFIDTLELIELVDCSPDAVEQEDFGHNRLQVRIIASWE